MTATQTAPFGIPQNLLAFLRRAGGFLGKALLALAIIFAAGVIAIATAIAGLAIASAALLVRLFGGFNEPTQWREKPDGEGITLEAHKTPRGWTVE